MHFVSYEQPHLSPYHFHLLDLTSIIMHSSKTAVEGLGAQQTDLNSMLHLINLFGVKDSEVLNMLPLSLSQSSTNLSQQDQNISFYQEIANTIPIDHLMISNHHQVYSEGNDISISSHSPSSNSLPPSPRTIHSSLSTPTELGIQSTMRFDVSSPQRLQHSIEEEKSIQFFDPFQMQTGNPSAFLVAQTHTKHDLKGMFTEKQVQTSFSCFTKEDIDREDIQASPVSNTKASVQKYFFEDQYTSLEPLDISYKIPSRTLDGNQTFIPNRTNDYLLKDQSVVSDRIRDFDNFIESLTFQSRYDKKRTQSKTFEDIMPYLSGNSIREPLQSVRPPFIHKRAKTQDGNLSNDGEGNSGWSSSFLLRQRQRSKANTTVYEMRNLPIIPLGSSFASLKEKHEISQSLSMNIETQESSSISLQSTMSEFVEQAAKTALKGAKYSTDLENSKRAIAGSKARDEQNREKSKRYYDRKKAQSSVMSGVCSVIDEWYDKLGVRPLHSQSVETLKQAAAITHQSFILPSERQKALKEVSKIREIAQIRTIMAFATKLKNLSLNLSRRDAVQMILRHGPRSERIFKDSTADYNTSSDLSILESGLHIWLDFLHCWSDLILAEKRLIGKTDERPIYHLIYTMSELLESP